MYQNDPVTEALDSKHWICNVIRLFDAILHYPQGPIAYYANLAIPINSVKTGIYVFECMMVDSLMVWKKI